APHPLPTRRSSDLRGAFDRRLPGDRQKIEKARRHRRGGRDEAEDEHQPCRIPIDRGPEPAEDVDRGRADQEAEGKMHRRRMKRMPEKLEPAHHATAAMKSSTNAVTAIRACTTTRGLGMRLPLA